MNGRESTATETVIYEDENGTPQVGFASPGLNDALRRAAGQPPLDGREVARVVARAENDGMARR